MQALAAVLITPLPPPLLTVINCPYVRSFSVQPAKFVFATQNGCEAAAQSMPQEVSRPSLPGYCDLLLHNHYFMQFSKNFPKLDIQTKDQLFKAQDQDLTRFVSLSLVCFGLSSSIPPISFSTSSSTSSTTFTRSLWVWGDVGLGCSNQGLNNQGISLVACCMHK